MPITQQQLNEWFTYHAPEGKVAGSDLDKTAAYDVVRRAGRAFAEAIVACTPASADQTAAVRKVREAVMTANAAIACDGK